MAAVKPEETDKKLLETQQEPVAMGSNQCVTRCDTNLLDLTKDQRPFLIKFVAIGATCLQQFFLGPKRLTMFRFLHVLFCKLDTFKNHSQVAMKTIYLSQTFKAGHSSQSLNKKERSTQHMMNLDEMKQETKAPRFVFRQLQYCGVQMSCEDEKPL